MLFKTIVLSIGCLSVAIASQKIGAHRQSSFNVGKTNASGNEKPLIILTVDGGGMRGITSAILIKEIEKKLGNKVVNVVDFFGGTSVGSLIVSMLTAPNKNYDGAFLEGFIKQVGKTVFAKPIKRTIRTLGGLTGSKYSAKPLEDLLKEKLGANTKVGQTKKPVLIVTLDFTHKRPFVFSSLSPDTKRYNLWEAARASSAAPVLFKGHEIQIINGSRRTLVDGGIAAGMSPDLYMLNEIKTKYPKRPVFFISLSAGQDLNPSKTRGKGIFAGSVPKVLKQTIITGLESSIDVTKMTMANEKRIEYHRIDIHLPRDCAYDVDNPSDKNMRCLSQVAQTVVRDEPFNHMVERLQKVLKGHPVDPKAVRAVEPDQFSRPGIATPHSRHTSKK